MRLALLLPLAAACSAPALPDAGPPDAGPPSPRHCVASSCEVSGNFQVVFTGIGFPPPLLCQAPTEKQLRFTSDGASLCMLDAVDGGSDGGCGFSFVTVFAGDAGITVTDTWALYQPDSGHLYGTWSTEASGAATCTGAYSVHAVR